MQSFNGERVLFEDAQLIIVILLLISNFAFKHVSMFQTFIQNHDAGVIVFAQ